MRSNQTGGQRCPGLWKGRIPGDGQTPVAGLTVIGTWRMHHAPMQDAASDAKIQLRATSPDARSWQRRRVHCAHGALCCVVRNQPSDTVFQRHR